VRGLRFAQESGLSLPVFGWVVLSELPAENKDFALNAREGSPVATMRCASTTAAAAACYSGRASVDDFPRVKRTWRSEKPQARATQCELNQCYSR